MRTIAAALGVSLFSPVAIGSFIESRPSGHVVVAATFSEIDSTGSGKNTFRSRKGVIVDLCSNDGTTPADAFCTDLCILFRPP
ncbi:hypothetical protein AAIH70_20955 [Neorhizobium sp. BT27B]|uniref:hypothetical protein n=1 Tax=Neorhizobium sp. BT27B TaxID=3142625 RepID=UPI003D2AB4A5